VPPTYREVPRLVCCSPERCTTEKVFRRKVEFEQICKPGCYTEKKRPDVCRTEEIVEVVPGRTEWVRTNCECAPCPECYKQVEIPPCYKKCEKTVTEEGVKYCAFTPPQYDLVAKVKTVAVDRPVHVPGEYKIEWCKEEFQPGHWEWRRTDCGCPKRCDCPKPCACPKVCNCPKPVVCSPKPGPAPCAPLRKGDFTYAPARD